MQNEMKPGRELLQSYANDGDEGAFQEIVERHLNLVYSTALRIVGDSDLAREVSQVVFSDLARKAKRLPGEVVLSGWLYRDATFVASKMVRTESRRMKREQQAAAEMDLNIDAENKLWQRIRPVIDDAMSVLKPNDRDAVVLRFFEGLTFRETGNALGISEDAARMRVERALDKLRNQLGKLGVNSTSSALAKILTASAITLAPAGMATGVVGLALTGVSQNLGTGTLLTNLLTMTKLKTTLASVAVAAGMATPLWIQLNANSELDVAQIELSQLHEELDGLQSENLSLSSQQAGEISGLTEAERFELLQLRGGVNSLRRQVEELLAKAETSESADQEDDEQTDKGSVLSVASYTSNISARVELGDTLITGGWEIEPGRKGYFVLSPHINFQNGDPASVTVSETILEITEELLESSGFPRPPAESDAETSSITMKTEDFQLVLERLMNDQFKRRGSERPAMQTTSGIGVVDLENPNGISTKKVIGTEIQINGESQFIGQTITYLPTVSLDGSFVNLNAVVDWNQLKPSEEQAR